MIGSAYSTTYGALSRRPQRAEMAGPAVVSNSHLVGAAQVIALTPVVLDPVAIADTEVVSIDEED